MAARLAIRHAYGCDDSPSTVAVFANVAIGAITDAECTTDVSALIVAGDGYDWTSGAPMPIVFDVVIRYAQPIGAQPSELAGLLSLLMRDTERLRHYHVASLINDSHTWYARIVALERVPVCGNNYTVDRDSSVENDYRDIAAALVRELVYQATLIVTQINRVASSTVWDINIIHSGARMLAPSAADRISAELGETMRANAFLREFRLIRVTNTGLQWHAHYTSPNARKMRTMLKSL